MNTTFLKNFVAAAEEVSISAAARKEHIAQSALSLQLKTLEDEAGCRLLKRSRHGVSLTDEGEIFYRYAKRILSMENELRDRVEESIAGGSGVLRLGIGSECISTVIERQLTRFGRRFPNLKYEISDKSSSEVLSELRNGLIDIGVIKTVSAPISDMRVHYKSSEPMAVLYDSGLTQFGENVSFSQLNGIPLCVVRRSVEMLRSICTMNGFEPIISAQCERFETAASLALHGKGAAVVPLTMALHYTYEDKRSYLNADTAKVFTADGKRIYPATCDACDATNNTGRCSIVLEKGFDGYLLYPMSMTGVLPIRCKNDARVGLSSIEETKSFVFDCRLSETKKGQRYAIGGIYMVNDFSELPNGYELDTFGDCYSIADDYRMEDLFWYGQKISAVSIQPLNDVANAMVLSVPEDGQYVDNIDCSAAWVKERFVPNIANYRYLAIRIINLEIESLAFSVGLLETRSLSHARLQENFLDTSVIVLSRSDHQLPQAAQEFIKEFIEQDKTVI